MVAKEAGITDNAAGYIYNYLGKAHQHIRDFKKAIVFHELHLKASKELGYKVEEGIAYEDLGHAYFKIGNYDKAILFHELFLDVAKQMESRAAEGRAYSYLGNDHFKLGNLEEAITYLTNSTCTFQRK